MNITIVALEIPYPPIHGARVDIWRRIKALSKLGVNVQLVCWSHSEPDVDTIAVFKRYLKDFRVLPFSSSGVQGLARRLLALIQYPLEVTSRIVYGEQWCDLVSFVKEFRPDVIIADQIHASLTAKRLSQAVNVPFVIRSHNIEHLYYQRLYKAAEGPRKILRMLSLRNLEKFEKGMLRDCLAFYDISLDDFKYWHSQGFSNGFFLPPLIDSDAIEALTAKSESQAKPLAQQNQEEYDIVFLGNLNAENNVAGIKLFLKSILPMVLEKIPSVRVLISGSNPVPTIINACKNHLCVDLKINPPSAGEIYQAGKILINPVATGSGVSIKSVDMLTFGKPIVCWPQGIQGLPEQAKYIYRIAESEAAFAEEIIDCLTNYNRAQLDKSLISNMFGNAIIEEFVNDLNHRIELAKFNN